MRLLQEFRSLVAEYYHLLEKQEDDGGGHIPELDKKRRQINLIVTTVRRYIQEAGVDSEYYFSTMSVQGVPREGQEIDLMDNIFNLKRFHIHHEDLLDVIDRATGVYLQDRGKSLARSFNPFYWINSACSSLARIPFFTLGILGLPQARIEQSILGRFLHGLLQLTFLSLILFAIASIVWIDFFLQQPAGEVIESILYQSNILLSTSCEKTGMCF